jgi:protein TonB
MGYQALLFCPDERTARTVTQVLRELDFSVTTCTEPFDAVKKLMAEHFDAVVVDCDYEQNATLLFRSARNAPNNQSSLAVAVVEGQTGVARAFRIGANLVLTKPVNVEQAKGTLRVARGLLRKSEAAKPAAGAASTSAKSPAHVPAPSKLAPQPAIPTVAIAGPMPISPLVPTATASSPTQNLAQASGGDARPTGITETDAEILELSEEAASPSTVAPEIPIVAPEVKIAASQPEIVSRTVERSPSSVGSGTGAASAPAPAREPKPRVATDRKPSTVIAEPEKPVEKAAARRSSSSAAEASVLAPTLTFGGMVGRETKSSGGGNKKALLAVAVVLLIAAGAYAAWTQWGQANPPVPAPVHVAPHPVTTPAAVPQTAPNPAPVATSSGTSSVTSSALSSTPDAGATPASAAPASKAPAAVAAAPPIVIKNGASQPTAQSAATTDAPPPSMTDVVRAGGGVALPSLMGSQSRAPTPALQVTHVSQGISRGLLVKQIPPVYPATALQRGTEGVVELLATISKDGNISAVKTLSGDAQLSHAAVEAVKQWKYKPYLLNGEPVEIQTQITVKFKLPR